MLSIEIPHGSSQYFVSEPILLLKKRLPGLPLYLAFSTSQRLTINVLKVITHNVP